MAITSSSGADSVLKIYIRLVNGETCTFKVEDPSSAKTIIEELSPSQLFSEQYLMLGGDISLSFIPTEQVERVMLIGENIPKWPYLGEAHEVFEINEEQFNRAYDPELYKRHREDVAAHAGDPQLGFTSFWTVSGVKSYWQVRMNAIPLEKPTVKSYIQSLFNSGGLHAEVEDGVHKGVAIVNPKNITRITFLPGPPNDLLPPGTWNTIRL
jgi:hypothetical protein